MNKDTFQAALTNVSDKYITEAANAKKSTSRTIKIWRTIAIAACALLVVSGGVTAAFVASFSAGKSTSTSSGSEYYSDAYNFGADSVEDNNAGQEVWYEDEAETIAETTAGEAAKDSDIATNGGSSASGSESTDYSKIIYTADLSMQSNDFDTAINAIDELLSKYNAYYSYKSISNSYSDYRIAQCQIRVPAENYNALLEEIAAAATVVTRYEDSEDVSEEYNDIESKLETAKTKLERLQALLEEAEDIDTIVALEGYISDAEYDIEYYQGLLNGYDSRVSYSTINITLEEVYKVDSSQAPLSFGQKLAQAFSQGVEGFTDGLQSFLLFFAENWTWFILFPVLLGIIPGVIVLIVVLVKRRKRR